MVYLDYAATAPLLEEVRAAMHRAEAEFFANASALHTPGHLAKNEIEETRELLAKLINAEPSEIIFTSGATESNNTVLQTFRGHKIETSPYEHHSIIDAAKAYRGELEPTLYSYMLTNNEIGEIFDLTGVVKRANRGEGSAYRSSDGRGDGKATAKAANRGETEIGLKATNRGQAGAYQSSDNRGGRHGYVHSDLTQALGKIPLDVKALGLDYATFSAHKIGGPIGVGALYIKNGAPFSPLLIGGNQEQKRRGGTYNTVGIIGFKAALEYAKTHQTWEIYATKVRELRDTLARRILKEIPGSSLNTPLEKSLPNILNASFAAAEGESIQLYLDAEGVVVSTGSACAAGDGKPSHVLMAKTGGDAEVAHSSIRFSFGLNNTMEDVDYVMRVLPPIIDRLQKISTIKL